MPPDRLLAAPVADARDHGGVVHLVRQYHRARHQLLQRCQRRIVRHEGRREQQCRFLAMQIGELRLKLHMIMRGPGNVACAARTGPGTVDSLMHGCQHHRMLAHAQIVVGTPDRDRPATGRGHMLGAGKCTAIPADIGKYPVPPFLMQLFQGLVEDAPVVHASTPSAAGMRKRPPRPPRFPNV